MIITKPQYNLISKRQAIAQRYAVALEAATMLARVSAEALNDALIAVALDSGCPEGFVFTGFVLNATPEGACTLDFKTEPKPADPSAS